MEGSFSTFIVNQWLNQVTGNLWASLHYDNPDLGGPDASEIFGGGYTRCRVTFTEPDSRAVWSLTDAKFSGLTAHQLTYLGLWDSAFGGNLIGSGLLAERVVVLDGQGYVIAAGELALSIG